jgi:hypothetical protein
LKQQWEIEPSLNHWKLADLPFMRGYSSPPIPSVVRGKFDFCPMVVKNLHLVCSLDITFMRPEEPGGILQHGGDIDNRIKTLLDSLAVPVENQVPPSFCPASNEDPFYCLLEDDCLVTGFQVNTERLLIPAQNPKESNVRLAIAVLIRPSQVTNENMRFLGGFL